MTGQLYGWGGSLRIRGIFIISDIVFVLVWQDVVVDLWTASAGPMWPSKADTVLTSSCVQADTAALADT